MSEQGTAKRKKYYPERPIKIKEEITIDEIKIEPADPESQQPHYQETTEEEFTLTPHFEESSSIRKVQSKSRANVRRRSNQGFNSENMIRNRLYETATADPKYQKPFLYGWRREVVYSRKDNDKASIAYWKGRKKFRTYTAISEHLEESGEKNLTMDNFLFYQIPLGGDSDHEIIRLARPRSTWGGNQETDLSVYNNSPPKIRSLREIYKEQFIDKRKQVEDESKNVSNETTTEKVTQTAAGKKNFNAASNPRFYKPFLHGWKREVIYKNRNTDMAIYYITPTNKIIQSIEGISDYLNSVSNNQLRTSNFTFYGGPLGINDPSKEIIRRLTATEFDHTTHSSSSSKRRNMENIKEPRFLKPFSYGWKREIVYRATRTRQDKFIDVYYYSEEGDKLRSKVEVFEYLKKNQCKTLTVDNFTFLQDAIGPPDPTKEIIRTATKNSPKEIKKRLTRTTAKQNSLKKIKKRLTAATESDHTTHSSSSSSKRRNIENIKDLKFLEPFSYGWKREIVYRTIPQQHKSIDVYYYTKEGEKLRSKVEIFEYLKKIQCKTLTADNFTFSQDAIRPPDPTKEIIRNAAKPTRRNRN